MVDEKLTYFAYLKDEDCQFVCRVSVAAGSVTEAAQKVDKWAKKTIPFPMICIAIMTNKPLLDSVFPVSR